MYIYIRKTPIKDVNYSLIYFKSIQNRFAPFNIPQGRQNARNLKDFRDIALC